MENYLYTLKKSGVSSHMVIGQLLSRHKPHVILDVGCGPGFLAKTLTYKPNTLIGLDKINFKRLESYKKVHQIHLDRDAWPKALKNNSFEAIILADILEHLENPPKTLNQIKKLLKNDGFILVSVPNAGFWLMRLATLFGISPKMDKGIFDKTHIHNYKKADMYTMLKEADFTVEKVMFTQVPLRIFFLSNLFFRVFPNLFSYQIIVKASKGAVL